MKFTDKNGLINLRGTIYDTSNPSRREMHLSRYRWIKNSINRYVKNRQAKCLEIGIGSGVYLPILLEVSDNVYVSDIEKSNIEQAKLKFSNIIYHLDDITSSKFPKKFFDLILFSEVIEHIKDSQKALNEIKRILKNDGVLILTTPQKYSIVEIAAHIISYLPFLLKIFSFIYKEKVPNFNKEHINLLTEKKLTEQLLKSGFHIIEKYKCGLYIPFLGEFFGEKGKNIIQKIEKKIHNGIFNWILWTQCYILKIIDPDLL